ncbi:MAG: DUF3108 domain-containing protein [Deltaproteobacteria bacterium]|nr:DUF3108 domain-containing protein [Deltaproteobacteria bacterium]
MTLEEARKLLGLGQFASRQEIRSAYRQEARRWHPDRAVDQCGEAEYRERMQQVNLAYQRIIQFIEEHRFELVENSSQEFPGRPYAMVEQALRHRGLEPAALRRFGGKPGLMQLIWILILLLLVNLGQPGSGLAEPRPGADLENLEYRVSLGIWSEVGVVHLRLSQVGPNLYRAEFSGAAQGMWRLLSHWLPEGYETDMVLEGGRLKPLVFREDFQAKGHRIRKEYRFDYSRRVLEVWRGVDYQGLVQSWQVPLREPVYDLLSLFYNFRLGAFGPLKGGETLRVALIPTPEPRELVLRIGPESYEGRKIMLEVTGPKSEDEAGPYFVISTPQWVPQEAWTRVPFFGKLAGHLLNPEGIMPEGSLNLSPAPPQKAP